MQLTLSDYKKIDGVMMFTSEKAEIFGLNTKYDLKVKKIEFNVDVDAAKFDKPVELINSATTCSLNSSKKYSLLNAMASSCKKY